MFQIRQGTMPPKRRLAPRHLADALVIVEGELGRTKEDLQNIQHRRVDDQVTKDRIEQRDFHDVGDRGAVDAVGVAVAAVALEGYPPAQVGWERLRSNGTFDPLQGVTHRQEQTGIDRILNDQIPALVVPPAPAFGVTLPVHPYTPTYCSLSVAYWVFKHKGPADRRSGRKIRAGLPQLPQHGDQPFTQRPAALPADGAGAADRECLDPLPWLYLRVPRRGRRRVPRHLFRLDGMARFLTRATDRQQGGMTAVAPPLRVYWDEATRFGRTTLATSLIQPRSTVATRHTSRLPSLRLPEIMPHPVLLSSDGTESVRMSVLPTLVHCTAAASAGSPPRSRAASRERDSLGPRHCLRSRGRCARRRRNRSRSSPRAPGRSCWVRRGGASSPPGRWHHQPPARAAWLAASHARARAGRSSARTHPKWRGAPGSLRGASPRRRSSVPWQG